MVVGSPATLYAKCEWATRVRADSYFKVCVTQLRLGSADRELAILSSPSSTARFMFCKWLDCTWSCANTLGWSEESEDNSWAVSGVKDSPLWLDSALVMTDSPPELPTVPKWGSRQLWQISSFCLIKASPVNQTNSFQSQYRYREDIYAVQYRYTHIYAVLFAEIGC